ncbi:MAG TPA: HAMP domain-containing sensor histidine kinase [Flavobacterium sp.]|uniref:sensor histidine kinase n=1 Tax=Flavobacterium sp. TaxID=239 RepID=UPI002BEBC94F|nr:HAMP domain-containing sensor histidine kinase [Flavobacterium sp.]HNP33817.1 HAMP domain-containing sensor histidine kinase [Flavobacterium sp.]
MKQLKFEHRKVVHYTLLTAIILLQIIAIITWYNETKLSEAFDDMATVGKINRVNSSMVAAQGYFNSYITSRDETSLGQYSSSLNEVAAMLDSLNSDKNNKLTESLSKKKQKTQAEILKVKASIDSIIEKQGEQSQNDFKKSFKFKQFETNKFLDDVKTDSYVKVDSASRKGLFARLGDAIANRVDVQKEYVNTVVTMQYKDKVMTGNLEEQLANVIAITNNYYANEFSKLKRSFSVLRNSDLKLMDFNNQLIALGQSAIADYTNDNPLLKPENQQQIADQYSTNKAVRSFTIVFLILLMLVISVILFNFTRIAFEYEKQLSLAKEKIRQSLNFKNRITGMISHEIRSPLSIISMYSKKSSASVKEPELKETFKSIEFTTNSLLLLSNQILEYSKDENHQPELKCRNIQLKPEIYQIINSMASLVETKGNTLEISSNLNDETVVYSDAAKIHQLFYNLIGNANKFTENGKIKINMNLEHISGYEMNLKAIISDTGIGIAESDLKNIFESYYQGTVSEKVNDLGVGLGLNICKEIIELFDGEINIQSKPDEGTTVRFNLILTQAE